MSTILEKIHEGSETGSGFEIIIPEPQHSHCYILVHRVGVPVGVVEGRRQFSFIPKNKVKETSFLSISPYLRFSINSF
jgi:hypothetical protein